MMETMRNAAKGWVAKVLIGLLAVSFAVWGIADVFTGRSGGALATAGNVEISPAEYDRAFRQYLENIRRQTGQVIAAEDARKLGMDRGVLASLIDGAALDSQAQSLNLAIPNAMIVAETASNPAFQDAGGKFDPDTFRRLLASNGISEAEYVATERRDRLRRAIEDTADGGITVPLSVVEATYRHRNEQRDARYFVVKAAETEVAAATQDEIKKEYESNAAAYTAPEYRAVAIIKVEPSDITPKITLTDAEMQAGYDRYRSDYFTPERRTILQLSFPTLDEANKARARLTAGTAFEDIAAEMKVSAADYTFADQAKSDFLDPAIANAAFSLAEGAVSEPVKGALATVLLKATKIVAEHQKSLDDVKIELGERLKLDRAREELQTAHATVEDALGGGAKFEAIANDNGLPLVIVPAVDQAGRDKDGNAVSLPQQAELLRAVFASDVGVENPVLSMDDGYIWYEVREVVPSALKPLDTVTEQARAAVTAAKVRALAEDKAKMLVERLKSGTPLEDLAREAAADVKSAQGLKRNETGADFDGAAVKALFAIPETGVTHAVEPDGKGAKIIQSQAVLLPPFNAASADAKAIADELKQRTGEDLLASYRTALQRDVGVSINETLWQQITGTTTQ